MSPSALASSILVAPLVTALAVTFPPLRRHALLVTAGTGIVLFALALTLAAHPTGIGTELSPYLRVDATTRLFALLIDLIFAGVALYVWNRARTGNLEGRPLEVAQLTLVFIASCNAVLLSNHLIVLWLALELSTLAAVRLIARSASREALQASWRYLLFSAVGLGLAFLGFLFLARSVGAAGHEPSFLLDRMPALLSGSADVWRRVGLILVIVGFGTKLGLAPMYTWMPETYERAPASTTALLAGVQFNAALVALIRVLQVYRVSDPELVGHLLIAIGLGSMAVSTFSIVATRQLGRLLGYASINHAGVIAIGLGVGGTASYGLLLYVVSNAFIKAILFLTAGKIVASYGTNDTNAIRGLIKDLPFSGIFLMVGTFALLGFPPFGSFVGELLVLSGVIVSGHYFVFLAFGALITITFVATGRTVFPMIWGESKTPATWPRQRLGAALPKLGFLAVLVAMGLYMPPALTDLFTSVAATLGGP